MVIDIGSNDATTLKCFKAKGIIKVGIDPTAKKYRQYYTEDIDCIEDFFPSKIFEGKYSSNKAKIITSIAMFYDLDNPNEFVKNISGILDKDGIWHFEQSYMPSMLRLTAYDTICHEHLEYYALRTVIPLLDKNNLRILDIQINDINGGSFAVTACHSSSAISQNSRSVVNWLLSQEDRMRLNTPKPYREFADRVFQHKIDLVKLIESINEDGKTIIGYGASTKGNVLLQFCNLTANEIPYIAEVNEDKYGSYTPGTNIPIISEGDAYDMNPDYFLVLPWHFKHNIMDREKEFILKGGKLIFPLPYIEIV